MPLQQTSGNVTADAYGGGAAAVPNYIEDVFSTWLYTGNGSTQTITNGIDLAGKGGLVWGKSRTSTIWNYLTDTVRGQNSLFSNDAMGQQSDPLIITSFNSNGFSTGNQNLNASGVNYASWTFRKQPKFFDVVTYTGTGANRTITHNLGSVPGCIIVKRTDTTGAWQVYHSSLANTQYTVLNTTAAVATGATRWNSTTPTSSVFSVGTDATVNASGGTYVAYVFASNAGGFGLTGTDNVISCGSFTTDGSGNATVNLGYEPQWILVKATATAGGDWQMFDNMRGLPAGTPSASAPYSAMLFANLSNAEQNGTMKINSTGLAYAGWVSEPFIYIAIRRGPMKVPTDGTKVLSLNFETTSANPQTLTTGFPVDVSIATVTSGSNRTVTDRLRGSSTTSTSWVLTDSTAAEANYSGFGVGIDNNTAIIDAAYVQPNAIFWNLRRSPNFCDVVCYTGDGTAGTRAHNLSAVPELMLIKGRSNGYQWVIYSSALGNGKILAFSAATPITFNAWNSTDPTSSNFSVSGGSIVNNYNSTFVAYLFATCPNVSKVGSYTGTGALTTINCGFTGGARFVLIKRTDSTANWCLWDTTRGMVSGTDPSLYLNGSAAQSNANSVYTAATGFQLLASPAEDVNTSGGTYIFLAIA